MPYTPTGPATTQALQRLHPDPFVQQAILRLHRERLTAQGGYLLQEPVRTALERAERLDGVAAEGHHGSAG